MAENHRMVQQNIRNRNARESHDRVRRIHLLILVVQTLTFAGMASTGVLLGWELWMVPFMGAGVVLSWIFHIRQRFSERSRLYFYVTIIWCLVVYHGVHPTSFADLSAIAAIEFALFALTDEIRLIDVGLVLYWFCFFWDMILLLRDGSFTPDALQLTRIELYIAVVITTYFVARYIIKTRRTALEEDKRVIASLTETKQRTADFLVHVSHAFRTPVNVVTGLSGFLYEGEEDREKRDDLRHMTDAGNDLSLKLDDLLDYTELETGRFSSKQEAYTPASVTDDVLAALHLHTGQAPPDVLIDVDAELPKMIRGDARRVKKVLFHVLDNALKYTRQGGVYARIYRESRPYGLNLCIDVLDTGCGMDAELLSRIKEGIYSAETRQYFRSEGFGLGLQIVYGITHAMNGFVKISSRPGRGTHVHVSIPQGIAEEGRCMELKNREHDRHVRYLRAGGFRVPAVRDYYTRMIRSVVGAFSLNMQAAPALADLKSLLENAGEEPFTHVWIGENEYREDPAFFDGISATLHVIVIAAPSFEPQPASRVTVLRKPFATFPLVAVLNAETEEDAKALLKQAPPVRFDGVRALVVDDEEVNLIVAKRILSDFGLKTELANSGKEAVYLARSNMYDVIFMDHLMPGMDGVTCAHRIRDLLLSEGRQVKIVALTANVTSGAREMFEKEGFDGFVAKPVVRAELERELNHVLKKPDEEAIPGERIKG